MENVLDKHGPWRFYLYYEITEICYTHRTNIRAHMEQRILIWDKFKANVHALEHIKYSFLHVLSVDMASDILYTLMQWPVRIECGTLCDVR